MKIAIPSFELVAKLGIFLETRVVDLGSFHQRFGILENYTPFKLETHGLSAGDVVPRSVERRRLRERPLPCSHMPRVIAIRAYATTRSALPSHNSDKFIVQILHC